jgi:hypothetical protein
MMAAIAAVPALIEVMNPGPDHSRRLHDYLSFAGLVTVIAAAVGIKGFFSTRGTWHGYVFRVGIIWLGGLMSIRQYWLDSTEGTPLSAEALLSLLGTNSIFGLLLGVGLFGIMCRAEEHRRSILAERARASPAGMNPRWPTWITEWLSACVAFAATLVIADYAGVMFSSTDHNVVFFVAVGIAYVLICLTTLVYFRTNARNRR